MYLQKQNISGMGILYVSRGTFEKMLKTMAAHFHYKIGLV